MAKLDELKRQREEIEAQITKIEEDERRVRENKVIKKIENMTPEKKKILLSLVKHDRTSCSDEHPCNGYSYMTNKYRCRKCMLMEILNGEHGGVFDFDISVEISEV